MRDEPVRLFERAIVQQQRYPLPRVQLPFFPLLRPPLLAAAHFCQPIPPFQFLNQIIVHRHGL